MPATTLTVASLKGGAGKTKTATNVAAELSLRGHRVLLIDLDPQATATTDCGAAQKLGYSIGELLNTPAPYDPPKLDEVLVTTELENLVVAPAIYLPLQTAEAAMIGPKGAMAIRKQIVDPLREDFDFIFIDTPPRLGALTLAGVHASDFTIPIVGPDNSALHGAYAVQAFVQEVNSYAQLPSRIPCWVAANWEDSAKGREILEILEADDEVALLSNRLPKSRRAGSAPTDYEVPMVAAQPGYDFSAAVRVVVDELLEVIR